MKREIKTGLNPQRNWALESWEKAAFIVVFCCISTSIRAQEERPIPSAISIEEKEENRIICMVEAPPEFIGGSKAMFKFLADNLHFTSDSTGIDGTIYVGFIVETDGSVSDVTIKRGLKSIAGEEAMRVVKLMSGKWKCGYQNGKPARVRFTLPIKIHLE
jgi:periplasmic protein TonB